MIANTTLLLPRTLESAPTLANRSVREPAQARGQRGASSAASVASARDASDAQAVEPVVTTRLLVPIDETVCSNSAVKFIASRAALLKQPTHVALVNVQYPVPIRVARTLGKEICRDHYQREAEKILTPARTRLERAGAKVSTRFVIGTPAQHLPDIATQDPADLIVMATHGNTGIAHLLFGSVAQSVANSTTKPMLVLKQEALSQRESLRVGIALDGSKYGLATALFVARHVSLFGSNPLVTLIHVAPELEAITVPGWIERRVQTGIKAGQAAAMYAAAYESVFAPVHEVLRAAGIEAQEARLVGEDASEQIAKQASIQKLDVVAMGSLGYGASRFSTLGSVAARVASRIDKHLLLVREA